MNEIPSSDITNLQYLLSSSNCFQFPSFFFYLRKKIRTKRRKKEHEAEKMEKKEDCAGSLGEYEEGRRKKERRNVRFPHLLKYSRRIIKIGMIERISLLIHRLMFQEEKNRIPQSFCSKTQEDANHKGIPV